MKRMVSLIQLNDMYDVCVALKQVNVMKILMNDIYDDVFPADDFMVLSETVQAQLRRRLGQTHDSRAKVWLNESIEEMGELSTPLITLVKRSWTDESFTSKLVIILDPFKDTLEKATKALKLSAKSPFDISVLDDVKAEFRFRDEDLDDIAEAPLVRLTIAVTIHGYIGITPGWKRIDKLLIFHN